MSQRQPKSGSKSRVRVRMRAPRRKPAGEGEIDMPAEHARVVAVLERLQPKINSLVGECLEKRETHLLFVLDSHSVLMRTFLGQEDVLAEFRQAMGHDTDVVVFPVELLMRLMRRIAESFPKFTPLIADIAVVPPPGSVRLFVQVGHSFQFSRLEVSVLSAGGDDGGDGYENLIARCGFTDDERKTVRLANGEEEGAVTVSGVLKVFLHADPHRVKDSMRGRIERFQRHAGGPLAAEQAKEHPREVGEVLMDTFRGDELRAALKESLAGDKDAFDRAFARVLDDLDASVS